MQKYKTIREQFNRSVDQFDNTLGEVRTVSQEAIQKNKRSLDVLHDPERAIAEIDKEFRKATGILNKKDQTFLWLAVALQSARWIFSPELEVDKIVPDTTNRKDADKEAKKEDPKNSKWYQDHIKDLEDGKEDSTEEKDYIPWPEYFVRPVPFDAMVGEGAKSLEIKGVTSSGKYLYSKNHHVATLGHDPVLGYIFGSINIMTSTITFNKPFWPTNKVHLEGKRKQTVGASVDFLPTVRRAIDAAEDDWIRIPAAVVREDLHLKSDEFTKTGLPLPFLSAERQLEFLQKGWNSAELKRILKSLKENLRKNISLVVFQEIMALLINLIIQCLHIWMYDERVDGSPDEYNVRTQKILAVSNSIAEGINVVYVAGNVAVGIYAANMEVIGQGLKKTDLGGWIEAIHQIATSKTVQERIRRQYLEQKLYERLALD